MKTTGSAELSLTGGQDSAPANRFKRRAPFRILIVMDERRLGRESIETAHVLKQFSLSGIRVFAYLDDREVLLDNLMDKMRLPLLV